jgi:D-aspartate ligase
MNSSLDKESPLTGRPPGAVVIGGDYQGLGIVRSLGKIGIPICVIDDEHSISRFSRYATHGIRVPDLRQEHRIIETLLDCGRKLNLQGWVLFPTRDEIVSAISRHRSALSELFRVPAPEWNTTRWVLDKRNTYKLAQDLNIPFPMTWPPVDLDDLEQVDFSFPLVLKPAIKNRFFYATKAKAWRVDNRADLRPMLRRANAIAGANEILIQDLIPGDGRHQFSYCAFFKAGKAVGSMVTRRRRQHPHDFGRASTFVETIDLPALEALSERFLKAIDYYGLVEVEFKLDPRDGQFKLLDINARTWGYHSLGTHAGVDFPRLLYVDQLSGVVNPCRGRPGVSWVRLLTDLPTGIIDVLGGRLHCRDFMHSLKNYHAEAVFNYEDPVPGLVECALLPYLSVKKGF